MECVIPMTETWVQQYAAPHSPGPDGEPSSVEGDMRDVRELLVQFHDEFDPRSGIVQRITTRHDGRIQQTWMRVRA